MNKFILGALLLIVSQFSNASYMYYYGTLYSNVCRSGYYYAYTSWQPVGTSCYTTYTGYGYMSAE